MIIGIESFRNWFRGYEDYYVLIGGTACEILMNEIGTGFRATKDIDMVLLAESLDESFVTHFWEFVKIPGYEHRHKSIDKPIYYRFTNPKSSEYPTMIELFSRRIEGVELPNNATVMPLQIGDDIASLSAILLDDVYYSLLRSGVTILDSLPVLNAAYLIPLKAKAWLDLSERKANDMHVDSKDIKKHKNDILRLSALLSPDAVYTLPAAIMEDMRRFLHRVEDPHLFVRVASAFGLSTHL